MRDGVYDDPMGLRLWSFQHSPNPLKVRLALAELDVAYETIEVNLFRREHRKPEYVQINPHRKVPVLEDEGEKLWESNAILTYLGKTRGRWLSGAIDEAHLLRWMFFESMHLAQQCGTLWWAEVVAPHFGMPGTDATVIDEAVEELERSLGVLEDHFATHRFLRGDELTLADCSVGVAVAMLRRTRLDDASRFPRVIAYRERIRERPSWAAAAGDAIHDLPGR